MSASRAAAPTRLQKIWRRTWIGGLMVLAMVGLFSACEQTRSPLPLLVVGVGLSAIGVFELARMGTLAGRGLAFPAALALAASATWVGLDPQRPATLSTALTLYGLALVGALCGSFGRAEREPAASLAQRVAAGLWVGPAMAASALVWSGWGTPGAVALVVLCKLGDIAGYYIGNAIGKSHPFPSISPGKTTAGCVGSLLAGCLAGVGLVALGLLEPLWGGLGAGLIAGASINLAAQAGDLLESAVKRRAAVKDSGPWFGPAGGALDLIDSFLLGMPVALFVWPFLFATV